MFVLDTNTLIYFFKDVGSVSKRMLNTPPAKIMIPSIVIYELEYGIAKSTSPIKRRNQLAEITRVCQVIEFTSDTAAIAGSLRQKLDKKGTPIGPYDVLIAASALDKNAVLVTNNTAEFSRVAGLKLENWLVA